MIFDLYHTGWDSELRLAADTHLPGLDWRWLKAQCYQESLFDPKAVSGAGAQGLMQIMPGTWRYLSDLGVLTDKHDPFTGTASIDAGAAYMSIMLNKWYLKRPDIDRLALALASYNAGNGNIIKAQLRMEGALDYAAIIKGLPDVTGEKHSAETITYVKRIFGHYQRLVLG